MPSPPSSSTTTDSPSRIGSVVGDKFKIVREVGSGGMGTVFEATHLWTGRRVAIKILHAKVARDRESAQRFLQEARASTEIAHPNIVDVLDMGEDPRDGSLYLVQEFLDGDDLHTHLDARGKLSPAEALSILLPVMDALSACHRRGIVHRDVKPENIMLSRSKEGTMVPKLVDFGVSKVMRRNKAPQRITDDGIALGTPQYMSPEQARGDVGLDPRTDLWSIGAVLFECITGSAPFEASTPSLLLVEIITRPPPRLDSVVGNVPKALVEAVARALDPDRERRFRRMEDFAGALRAIPRVLLGAIAPDSSQRSLPSVSPGARRARPDAPTTILWTGLRTAPAVTARRDLLTRAAIVVTLLCLVALLVVFASPPSRTQVTAASLPSEVPSLPAPTPAPRPVAQQLVPTVAPAPLEAPEAPTPVTHPSPRTPRPTLTRTTPVRVAPRGPVAVTVVQPTAPAPAVTAPAPRAPEPSRPANGSVLLEP